MFWVALFYPCSNDHSKISESLTDTNEGKSWWILPAVLMNITGCVVLYYRHTVLIVVLKWPFASCFFFFALESLKVNLFVQTSQLICVVDRLTAFYLMVTRSVTRTSVKINPLSANPTKWSNTQMVFLQFADKLFECDWPFCGVGA